MPRTYRKSSQVLHDLQDAGHDVVGVVRIQGRLHGQFADGTTKRVDQIERTADQRVAEYERNKETYALQGAKAYQANRLSVIDAQAKKYAERRKAGLCTRCGDPLDLPNVVRTCESCWWKNAAAAHLGSAKHAASIVALYEAWDGKCYLTGLPLLPGENLSFDHVEPRSAGGDKVLDIENLAPCHKDVNVMKNALPLDAFVDLCKLVANNSSR